MAGLVEGETRTKLENSVRMYLVALRDPSALVDHDEIAELEREYEQASDPIEQLRALSSLERARVVDVAMLEQAFVRDARRWAEQERVAVEAFRALGVPESTLSAAGLTRSQKGGGSRRGRAQIAGVGSVKAASIQRRVLELDGSFSLLDVASLAGGSPMTIRKAVAALVEAGRVRRLGPDPSHSGRGRAPVLYQVVASSDPSDPNGSSVLASL
ncbi:MAG: hypothetical protein ACK5CE_09310 [Actinomycetes bacterium]